MIRNWQKHLQNSQGETSPAILFAMCNGGATRRDCNSPASVQNVISGNAYGLSRFSREQHKEKVQLQHGDVIDNGAVMPAPPANSRFYVPVKSGTGKRKQ
jgi:hypothetical protein